MRNRQALRVIQEIEMAYTQLIYLSNLVKGQESQLGAILESAVRHNSEDHITGMLLYAEGNFLQVLEGDREPLNDLYGRLTHDTRHRRLLLLGFEAIDERLFPGWSMGFAAADASQRIEYLRFGATSQFDPYRLTGPAALGLLTKKLLGVEI